MIFKLERYSTRQKVAIIAPLVFWYLAFFPGRLGYDYALLARMIRSGDQTSWWGATYFWFFKFSTFNAQTIALTSFLGLVTLAFSILYFIDSLNIELQVKRRVTFMILWTPLFGTFGVTVSHDLFQTSGILLLTALIYRSITSQINNQEKFTVLLGSGICLTTTQLGLLLFFSGFILLAIQSGPKRNLVLVSLFVIAFAVSSNLPINTESSLAPKASNVARDLLLIDIKCIAQHPAAEITPAEWAYLSTWAPIEKWKQPVSCSNPDELAAPIKQELSQNASPLDLTLLKTSIKIISRQPAIPVMSHIQRSRVALPPPFFQPPSNQVDWDISKPLGINSNVALQDGPELLHPSIDDPVFAKKLGFLKPLEALAQFPTFLVNQASWFWSWGGLWLYPLLFFFYKHRSQKSRIRKSLIPLIPTFLLHFALVLIGPSSLGRYVMSTILMGFIATLTLFFSYLNSQELRESSN